MTIYEVMYDFLEYAFPASVVTANQGIIDLTAFIMTYFVVFGVFVFPLWYLTTFFLYYFKRKKNK